MASAPHIKSPSDQFAGTRGLQELSNADTRSSHDNGIDRSEKSFDSTFDPYAGICPVCIATYSTLTSLLETCAKGAPSQVRNGRFSLTRISCAVLESAFKDLCLSDAMSQAVLNSLLHDFVLEDRKVLVRVCVQLFGDDGFCLTAYRYRSCAKKKVNI